MRSKTPEFNTRDLEIFSHHLTVIQNERHTQKKEKKAAHAFPLYVLVCCVWAQIMYKFAAHAAVAPACCRETTFTVSSSSSILYIY